MFGRPSNWAAGALRRLMRRTPEGPLFWLKRLHPRHRIRSEAQIRALCHTVPLGDGRVLARILGRFKIVLDAGDRGLSPHLMLDGYWEMWVTEVVAAAVTPGMVALDIGANLGYYTLLLSKCCGEAGSVHAFEPNPHLAGLLRQSLALNGFNATVWEVALSDRDGEDTLFVPEGDPKNGHLTPGPGHVPQPGDAALAVPTRTLDSLGLARVDFIKMDAEGAEERIWRGMAGVLAANPDLFILMEFNRGRYQDPVGFLDSIHSQGFAMDQITVHDGIQPVTPAQLLTRPGHEDWMLVLRRGRHRPL